MARYVKELAINKPESFVNFIMEDYLNKNCFQAFNWKKKEPVFRAGDRMLEGFKYLKWTYNDGVLRVEAWLNGLFGSEMGLSGFFGTFQKTPYRKSLEQLFEVMQQELPEDGAEGVVNPQPIPVKTVDNTGAATTSLVLGIISIPAALLIPLLGLICACLGYSRGRMGSGSSNAGMAKAGKVLCTIGALASVGVYIFNIVYTFSYMF